jgi:hypothetical protein
MPRAKKQAEEQKTEPAPEPPEFAPPFDVSNMIDPETMTHLMKAGMELMQAMEKTMPKKSVPPEVKAHAKNIEREFLLMTRAMIDHKIKDIDSKKTKKSEPKLKKIELQ